MVIEEFQGSLGNLKNLTAEAADDALGRQQIVAPHAVVVGWKSDSDHSLPPLKCTRARKSSQGGDSEDEQIPAGETTSTPIEAVLFAEMLAA